MRFCVKIRAQQFNTVLKIVNSLNIHKGTGFDPHVDKTIVTHTKFKGLAPYVSYSSQAWWTCWATVCVEMYTHTQKLVAIRNTNGRDPETICLTYSELILQKKK